MSPNELALMRGWIQGLDWETLSDLYLDSASIQKTKQKVKQLRHDLKRKARLLKLPSGDLPDKPPILNENLQKKGISWVNRIAQLPRPTPLPEHALKDWMPSDVALKLNKLYIKTLEEAYDGSVALTIEQRILLF